MLRRWAVSLVMIVSAVPAVAAERYLVPTFVAVPGAHGSAFVAELSVMAAGSPSETVQLRGLVRCPCPGVPTPISPVNVNRGRTYSDFESVGRPGLVVVAPDGARLQMRLRVRDTSRNHLSAGTEIPVVRESRMVEGPLSLLSVSADDRFRNRLRVYAFMPGIVKVVFYSEADDVVIYETTLSLALPANIFPQDAEFFPAFAELAEFPATSAAVRIQVEPVTNLGKMWAFVTTTNNQTQEITTVTPQP